MKVYVTTIYKNGQECEKYLDLSRKNAEAFVKMARLISKEYTGQIKEVEMKEDSGQ